MNGAGGSGNECRCWGWRREGIGEWVSVPEGEGWSVEGVGVREGRGVNVVRVVGGFVK